MTMPSTRSGTAKVGEKGVQLHYEFYWSDAFRRDGVRGPEVPIRYDPFDISRAFAYVKGQWVQCFALHQSLLHNRSERELKIISAELRQRRSSQAKQYKVAIQQIAEFLASVGAAERLGMHRLYDEESRQILQVIDASYVNQFSLFQQAVADVPTPEEEDDDIEEIRSYGEYC